MEISRAFSKSNILNEIDTLNNELKQKPSIIPIKKIEQIPVNSEIKNNVVISNGMPLLFEVELVVRDIGKNGNTKYISIPKSVRKRAPDMFKSGSKLIVSEVSDDKIVLLKK